MGKKEETAVLVGITEAQVKALISEAVKGLATEEGVRILIIDSSAEVGKMIAAALQGYVTESRVETLVQEGFAGTVDLIAEAIQGLVTVEQAKELFNEAFSGMIDTGGLQPLPTTEEVPALELDPEWLAGLTFQGAKREVLKVKGQRPKLDTKPFSRPLAQGDVLSFSVGDDAVTLVTADGKKHTVAI